MVTELTPQIENSINIKAEVFIIGFLRVCVCNMPFVLLMI